MLVHGFTGSRDDFREQMAPLAEHGRTLAPDQRGHGGSTNSGKHELYTVGNLVLDLKGAFDALGLERVDLLGHSLGGFVTLRFALAYPERVASLVLMDTSPRPIKMRFSESARAGIAAFAREHGMIALAKRNREFATTSPDVPPSAPTPRGAHGRRTSSGSASSASTSRWIRSRGTRSRRSSGRSSRSAERLGEIRCPTTVVVGAEDLALPEAVGRDGAGNSRRAPGDDPRRRAQPAAREPDRVARRDPRSPRLGAPQLTAVISASAVPAADCSSRNARIETRRVIRASRGWHAVCKTKDRQQQRPEN